MEDNRILLPITIDKSGRDYIEILPYKAKAGYLSGYSDPEFIEKLQQMHLPFLTKGKFRAFPIEGDSMPPHNDKSFIVGRYIEKISDIKDGKTYVVLSKNDGIVYKRLFRKPKRETIFFFHSDNTVYKPYEVKAGEILEIWEHVCSFCTQEFQPDDLGVMNIKDMFQQLRVEISGLKKAWLLLFLFGRAPLPGGLAPKKNRGETATAMGRVFRSHFFKKTRKMSFLKRIPLQPLTRWNVKEAEIANFL